MFIQIVQGMCLREKDLREVVDDWCRAMAGRDGWLGGTYGFTDDHRFVGVVRFESAQACRHNALRPDAGLWWAVAADLFYGYPRCHESEDVALMLSGGSDAAGFVQVVQGKVADPEDLRRMTRDVGLTTMHHGSRPGVIGSTLVIEEDGTFIETIAFTGEDAASRPESPLTGVTHLDLHDPWFRSHD